MKKSIQNLMFLVLVILGFISTGSISAAESPANPCSKSGCVTRPGANNGVCTRMASGESWCCVAPAPGATGDCFADD